MRWPVASSAILLGLTVWGITPPEKKVVPAIDTVEPWQQVGQQPYEMTWVQREQDPRTLEDFEDLKGWTLELFNGAQGELRRSREQQLWGEHVAKIGYSGTGATSHVIARPPKPLPIPGPFDCVDIWGYGNRWDWIGDKTTPPANVSILIVDSQGKEFMIPMTEIRWKQWWLIHRKIQPDLLTRIVPPASFSGLEISKLKNKEPRDLFFDSLAFYKEDLPALHFDPQPKRNLAPYHGEIVGLNTGPGTLPFPTREQTILPTNFETKFKATVRAIGQNRFEFRYQGADASVVYEFQPRTGNLGELTASVDGGARFRPLDGGGIRFYGAPPGSASEGHLVSASLDGDVVKASFRYGAQLVDYQLRLWQKSLVLDVWCDGGAATEFSFGRVSGVDRPKPITVPYITYGPTNPRVLMSGSESQPVFTSVWFDWYRSNASEPYASNEPKVTADSAEINGGMRYIAKTDGRRNGLYERIFVTNSPRYEEVLPTIANPPSLRQQEGKQAIWTVTGAADYVKDHKRCQAMASYGLDKIMQHSHEGTWRDEGDSNTLRLQAAPQKGGDAMLQWYVAAQNELGWLQGVYTNYTDFCPVNTNWNPDWVRREPSGEWGRAWPRNYAEKPSKAVEFDDYYAPRIKAKFGVKMSYTDVHTAVAPWRYCDYDARVPGAGTFAATFYAYGQLLVNDQRVYGPTQSEGSYQWLYAGLASGSYGWVYTKVNLLTRPLDVAFHLMKIHSLECDYGMGSTHYYLSQIDPNWSKSPKWRDYVDLFLATTIGYGNTGWLVGEIPSEPQRVEAMARSYYMMQQLQRQYAFVPPKSIAYADRNGHFFTPSQALANDVIANSRLRVAYDNGTQVYVNRDTAGEWPVPDPEGNTVVLPVNGWLAFNRSNHFYELSANAGGRRIDYVSAPEFEFLDGRGQWAERGNLGAAGSVALRQKGAGRLELIDIYGNDRIAFRVPAEGVLTAYGPQGESLGSVDLGSPREGWREFRPLRGGRRYVFAPAH